MYAPMAIVLSLLLVLLISYLAKSSVCVILPHEVGLLEQMGKFKRVLGPGLNLVPPLISRVIKMDLRTIPLDVPDQEIVTKDKQRVRVGAVIHVRVVDPIKAYYEIEDYRRAIIYMVQTLLRALLGGMDLDEISSRARINNHLRDILNEAVDRWGIRVETVETRMAFPFGADK